MGFQNIILNKDEGMARLVLNRPPLNIIDFETLMEINTALEELKADEATRVLVITGSGSKAFSAGVEVRDHLGEMMPRMMAEFGRLFRLLREVGKPSIAAVNGVALGGGCELVAGCDIVIASEKAQFGQPEIKLGVYPPAAPTLFSKIVGEKKAFELILLGENIDATEAARIGLVNKVVPQEELEKTTLEFAHRFLEKSGLILMMARDAFYSTTNAEFERSLASGTELGCEILAKEDAIEGLTAYLEKRKPIWRNK